MVGQAFYPIYPRDLVFGLLPFAMLAFLRATDGERARGPRLGRLAGAPARRLRPDPDPAADPDPAHPGGARRGPRAPPPGRWARLLVRPGRDRADGAALVGPRGWPTSRGRSGRTAACPSTPRRTCSPARIGFWQYPIQFGLILPLAIVGAGVVLSFLRRASGPRTRRRPGRAMGAPARSEAPLLLLPVVARAVHACRPLPAHLAAGGRPSAAADVDGVEPAGPHPGGDRPGGAGGDRASTLATAGQSPRRGRARGHDAGRVRARRPWPPSGCSWTSGRIPATPTSSSDPTASPTCPTCSTVDGPRPTILTYEDWSSLVWYDTGASVVAVLPPGYAKLAFDPAVFTGVGQDRAATGPRERPDRRPARR